MTTLLERGLLRIDSRQKKMAASSADEMENEFRNLKAVILEFMEKAQLVLCRDLEPSVKQRA